MVHQKTTTAFELSGVTFSRKGGEWEGARGLPARRRAIGPTFSSWQAIVMAFPAMGEAVHGCVSYSSPFGALQWGNLFVRTAEPEPEPQQKATQGNKKEATHATMRRSRNSERATLLQAFRRRRVVANEALGTAGGSRPDTRGLWLLESTIELKFSTT